MNTLSSPSPTAVLAVDVQFSDDAMMVRLSDGREISVPLEWFPRLRDATATQRQSNATTGDLLQRELECTGKKLMRILRYQLCCGCDAMTGGGETVRQIKIIVEKHSDGYVAYPIGLKGVVVGEGDTYKEAMVDVKSAIQFHIETFGKQMVDSKKAKL